MSAQLRVAVIGGGNMGRYHLRNYAALAESDLIALADVNPDTKVLADEYGAQHFTDYKKMIDTCNLDAVSIVVPTPLHAQVATYAMSKGLHVLLEKPIASTIAEANKLIKLAESKKLVFTVGHIEHYSPLVRAVKTLIDDRAIGDVTSIVCKRVGIFPSREPKTDVVLDLAVHDIGIINYILGRLPEKIACHGSRTHHSCKVDAAEILMNYGNTSGFILANWITPVKIRSISVTGSEGYIEGNYVTQELELYRHTINRVASPNGFSEFVMDIKTQDKESVKIDVEEPLARELRSFMRRINGDVTIELVRPEEARDALKLALQAARLCKPRRIEE